MRRGKFPVCLNLGHQFRIAATRYLATVLFATGAFLAATNCVQSAPIYSQVFPSDSGTDFTSINEPSRQKVADNFRVEGSGTYTVKSLRFLGGYGENFPPPPPPPPGVLPPDDFRLVFLEDISGSPGAIIPNGDFSITSVHSRVPTGGQLLNGLLEPIEYSVDLGNGVILNKDSAYWLSISNAPGPDHGWGWARAGGVFGPEFASTTSDVATGPWTVGNSSGMWFELSDANIPEPQSQALLLVVVLTAISKRRRELSLMPHPDKHTFTEGDDNG